MIVVRESLILGVTAESRPTGSRERICADACRRCQAEPSEEVLRRPVWGRLRCSQSTQTEKQDRKTWQGATGAYSIHKS